MQWLFAEEGKKISTIVGYKRKLADCALSSILVLIVAPDPELSATSFIPALWREVKIVVGCVHKVNAGAHELITCERRYLQRPG
jgi:hypothetical protein